MAVRCRPLVTPKEKSDFYRKSRKEACIRASHLTVALIQQYSAGYPLIGRPDKINVKLWAAAQLATNVGFVHYTRGSAARGTHAELYASLWKVFVKDLCPHSYTTKICIPHQIPPNNGNHLVSGRIKIGRAKGSELRVETKIEVIAKTFLITKHGTQKKWLRVASDHMKSKIYEKEQNPRLHNEQAGEISCTAITGPLRKDTMTAALQNGERRNLKLKFEIRGKNEPRTAPFFPTAAVTNH